jgi:hypothetical protein
VTRNDDDNNNNNNRNKTKTIIIIVVVVGFDICSRGITRENKTCDKRT